MTLIHEENNDDTALTTYGIAPWDNTGQSPAHTFFYSILRWSGTGLILKLESSNFLCIVLIGCFSNVLMESNLSPVFRNLNKHTYFGVSE